MLDFRLLCFYILVFSSASLYEIVHTDSNDVSPSTRFWSACDNISCACLSLLIANVDALIFCTRQQKLRLITLFLTFVLRHFIKILFTNSALWSSFDLGPTIPRDIASNSQSLRIQAMSSFASFSLWCAPD